MADTQQSSEHSPLLQKSSSKTSFAEDSPDGSPDNAEIGQDGPSEQVESPEILEARKNVKRLMPALAIGGFLAFTDQNIVAAINEDIGSELNALRSVSWVATAYFLSMTCSQPLYGKLSDVFGRKSCLLVAYAIFGIGSLGCGLAATMPGLIAARAVQGIGGGGLLIVVTVLLSDFISLRERGTYQGYLNIFGAVGATSGGPIAILLIGYLLHIPLKKSDTPLREQLKRIDFLGAFLIIATVFGILFGLDRGTSIAWRDPVTLVSLCATVPCLLGFIWVETRYASQPFLPGHIIFDKALYACYAQNFFGYAGFTALIFYLPMFFQAVLEMSPARAGVGLIPAAISTAVGTLLGGIIMKRIGKFYWLALVSSIVGALAVIPIAIAPSLHRGALIATSVASVISFVPQGITITASLIAITDQAVATACSFLFRSLGAAVGVSLVGIVIQEVVGMRLRASLDTKQANRILEEIARSLDLVKDLPDDLRIVVRNSYGDGVQGGFIMCGGFLAMSALSVIWWRERKMMK
ncbi:MAG: hypothetical protein Q9220_006076 [cf. Caloplaca sp. 1 TL-2023]